MLLKGIDATEQCAGVAPCSALHSVAAHAHHCMLVQDFAFALPLVHPSGVDCELLQAACFGVFDGEMRGWAACSLSRSVV